MYSINFTYIKVLSFFDIFLLKTIQIIQMFHLYNLSIITIFLVVLFPSFCATSQRYQLFFNESTNPTSNRQFRPIYDLGILQAGHSISITLTLPNSITTNTLSGLITGDSNNALKLYFDYWTDSQAVNTRQALTEDGNTFHFPAASLSSHYAASYRITFGKQQIKSARFKLALFSSDYTASKWFKLTYIYLKVTYKSDEIENEGRTLLQVTQTLRNNLQKVFYVAPSAPPFNFSFFPVTLTENGPNNPFQINLYSILLPMLNLQDNEWDLKVIKEVNKKPFKGFAPGQTIEEQLAQKTKQAVKFYGNVAHYSIYLLSGFYLLDINYRQDSTSNGFLAWGKFYTDAYACPYNPQFTDINGNFQGCTPQYNLGGPNCVTYDENSNKCLLCLPGQVLNSQGKCGDNPKCPPRKYSNLCLDVNPLCGNFDVFTGECFSCLDPQKYQVKNRQCVKKIRCHQRQWVFNDTCMDVSPDCGQFDRSNGKCLSCKDPFYEINIDEGTCELAGINGVSCPPGQYAVRYSCMHIPLQCADFDKMAGKCLKCVQGYSLQKGKCTQIQNK